MVRHAISPAPRRALLYTAALAPLARQCKGCCDNNCKECHGTEQVHRCDNSFAFNGGFSRSLSAEEQEYASGFWVAQRFTAAI
jgi:hypothetical protein